MTEQQILNEFAGIVEEITRIPADNVTAEKSFVDDLDIDSLSMVEIATAAEDKFEITIPDSAIGDMHTVADAVDYIAKTSVPA